MSHFNGAGAPYGGRGSERIQHLATRIAPPLPHDVSMGYTVVCPTGAAMRLAFLLLAVAILAATPTLACPTGVTIVDGDSIAIDGEEVRLTGFDTPEVTHARCPEERVLGERATARLEELVCRSGEASVAVVMSKRRPGPAHEAHGRPLARIVVDGLDVGEVLIAEGLARRRKPTRGWCAVLGVTTAPNHKAD